MHERATTPPRAPSCGVDVQVRYTTKTNLPPGMALRAGRIAHVFSVFIFLSSLFSCFVLSCFPISATQE